MALLFVRRSACSEACAQQPRRLARQESNGYRHENDTTVPSAREAASPKVTPDLIVLITGT